jgi:hypothetical protein
MPSSITCPECKARISITDDRARQPAECPECGASLRSSTRPESKSYGPPPAPRKPPRDDDDDRPARRYRPRDDDDRSTNKTRRTVRQEDDLDRPAKKKSKLPLVLGILAGVLFLGCGACGGIGYYFYSKGKDVVQERMLADGASLLRDGMTQAEVETTLGSKGEKLNRGDFDTMTANNKDGTQQYINDEHKQYWTAWVDKGLVYRWQSGRTYVLIAYNNPPESGGKLKGLSYQVPSSVSPNTTVHNERIKLPRNPSADDDAVRLGIASRQGGPVTPKTKEPKQPKEGPKTGPKDSSPGDTKDNPLTATVTDIVADPMKYETKWVIVTGLVADLELLPSLRTGSYLLTADGMPSDKSVQCAFSEKALAAALVAAQGDELQVTGQCFKGAPGPPATAAMLSSCEFVGVKHLIQTISAVEITREFFRDPAAAAMKYKGKKVRIGGSVLEAKPQGPGDGITLRGVTMTKPKMTTRISAPCGVSWKSRFEAKRPGEQANVFGEVLGYSDGVLKLGDCWLLSK